MIRVYKRNDAPDALAAHGYKDDAVSKAIKEDQYDKCYLCERVQKVDYQIEHLVSRHEDKSLENDWRNLFLACDYCNKRKGSIFNDIVPPNNYNVEEVIEQRLDYRTGKVVLSTADNSHGISSTINLLERLFNGMGKMRNLREEEFFRQLVLSVNAFKKMTSDYLDDLSDKHRNIVIDALNIRNEYLGFKYWIIKDNPLLYKTFKDYIAWNKTY